MHRFCHRIIYTVTLVRLTTAAVVTQLQLRSSCLERPQLQLLLLCRFLVLSELLSNANRCCHIFKRPASPSILPPYLSRFTKESWAHKHSLHYVSWRKVNIFSLVTRQRLLFVFEQNWRTLGLLHCHTCRSAALNCAQAPIKTPIGNYQMGNALASFDCKQTLLYWCDVTEWPPIAV